MLQISARAGSGLAIGMPIVGLVPVSPSFRSQTQLSKTVVIGRGRFCFERAGQTASAVQLPSCPADELWSPPSEPEHRHQSHMPDLEFIFAVNERLSDAMQAASSSLALEAPGEDCCICLEEIAAAAHGCRPTALKCPQCSMRAHPACLAKWFGTAATSCSQTGLPRSSVSCPNCRGALDWDALALMARRKEQVMPLAMTLAASNKVFNNGTRPFTPR